LATVAIVVVTASRSVGTDAAGTTSPRLSSVASSDPERTGPGRRRSMDKQGPKAAGSKRSYYERNSDLVKQKSKEKKESMKRFVDAVKSFPCQDCESFWPVCAMQLDHREPSQKVKQVSTIINFGSWSKTVEEIMKCDLVCANCHAIRTHQC
jgi:hypothetical protein